MEKTVRLLGTRGVPAAHGGFETAVENVGLELVRRGWRVVVYCQEPRRRGGIRHDVWRGIERVRIPERYDGPLGTIWFDGLSVAHAARFRDPCVTFGYNTAFLTAALRARGIRSIVNMDGIEWRRARWSRAQQRFLHVNEKIAARTAHHLVADHPEIERHLADLAPRSKITTIAYGAPSVEEADPSLLDPYGVVPGRYLSLVARPVAENSILEMVTTFSRKRRGVELLVLGTYDAAEPYQSSVLAAASDEVRFVGAVYDPSTVAAIRFHSLAYLHGHTVGGTNPSLVEALGCGNPVVAHDNPFNRWVAQDAALYFRDAADLDSALERLLADPGLTRELSDRARARHHAAFRWPAITDLYESVILTSPGATEDPRQGRGGRDSRDAGRRA